MQSAISKVRQEWRGHGQILLALIGGGHLESLEDVINRIISNVTFRTLIAYTDYDSSRQVFLWQRGRYQLRCDDYRHRMVLLPFPEALGTHHLHGAVFGVKQQLVAPQECGTGVVPFGQEGEALILGKQRHTVSRGRGEEVQGRVVGGGWGSWS